MAKFCTFDNFPHISTYSCITKTYYLHKILVTNRPFLSWNISLFLTGFLFSLKNDIKCLNCVLFRIVHINPPKTTLHKHFTCTKYIELMGDFSAGTKPIFDRFFGFH